MKKFAGVTMILMFVSASAFGGTVSFINPSQGGSTLVYDQSGGTGTYDVELTSTTTAPFSAIDIIIGSESLMFNPVEGPGGFEFSSLFITSTLSRGVSPQDQLTVPNEIKIGGINFLGNTIPAPITVGTLTIIVPAGLAPGDYTIFVDTSLEANGVSSTLAIGGVSDPLTGLGIVTVVPEPATLVLLGCGALMVLRRRRRTV